ncbi:diguanylate cyclase domain-containing protein [Rhizobium sp. SL86]|uniref:diguanylate cyclase domain-containing protein n=1 Tax=Rhizobium sp. SL86 TaxID=2995148 RepID=UPI002273C688|nr:diguanylate cyclase [Rhizobium sp. SL86]MCY1667722.1 diguanylate cyclase [Rhizobium sp. SL86]
MICATPSGTITPLTSSTWSKTNKLPTIIKISNTEGGFFSRFQSSQSSAPFIRAFGQPPTQEVGERLSAQSHATPQFHRLGGDEFAFYMSATGSSHDLQGWANSVIASLKKPMRIGHRAIEASASVGMAIGPDMSCDALQLYEFADYALYVAKRNGGGMAEIFSTSHRQAMRSEREIEMTLKAADLDLEIHSLFQPIMDTNSGMPQFFEILARWHSPTLGEVYPDTFIPIAERTGLIWRITVCQRRLPRPRGGDRRDLASKLSELEGSG